jgi:hypothetical protein
LGLTLLPIAVIEKEPTSEQAPFYWRSGTCREKSEILAWISPRIRAKIFGSLPRCDPLSLFILGDNECILLAEVVNRTDGKER